MKNPKTITNARQLVPIITTIDELTPAEEKTTTGNANGTRKTTTLDDLGGTKSIQLIENQWDQKRDSNKS